MSIVRVQKDNQLIDKEFNQGDMLETVITYAGGNTPVEILDFTSGEWKTRPRFDV